jgi:formylglycine-generating enzyme required for sulfatase activity
LEQLNFNDYPDDPLFQAIERDMIGEMVVISGGSYHMGSDHGDSDEKPMHRVSIRSFLLGKHEVTQAQWRSVMGKNPSKFLGCDSCPVEKVSWDDTQDFIKKLNHQIGGTYRLPTDAEWEYACRSGGKDEKYCGGANATSLAWYRENSSAKTHPVGQKQPNGLGLYDMSGNVYEWTQDCWNDSYLGAPSDGVAWQNGTCGRRALRGGSWFNFPWGVRSANRYSFVPDARFFDLGFRLARDI